MFICVDSARVAHPLFQAGDGGSNPASTLQASDLVFEPCDKKFALALNRKWHSRLPELAFIGIKYAFHARFRDTTIAVAVWSGPVARMLPKNWLELRRMACSPEMPKNGASAFLSWMVRYLMKHSDSERFISYQDTDVHQGTIYRASGWTAASQSRRGDSWKRECRERKNLNGDETIASPKIRWERVRIA
jgi:hypothetical protein